MNKLEFPDESHRVAYETMIAEWRNQEATPTAPGRLFVWQNFDEFLEIVRNDRTNSDPQHVSAHLFLFVHIQTKHILWAIQIRHHINHPRLIEAGGHIGYGIKPNARGNGYATEMLALALKKAKTLGLDKVLITCDDDNIASAKVIEANGGVFERYAQKKENEKKTRRYWITIR